MGAWGDESCSNDGCWDLLGVADIYNMTPEQIEAALKDAEESKWAATYERLGVVIWVLRHGWTVPEKYLKIAKDWVKKLIDAKSWDEDWCDPKSRRRQLLKEQTNVEEALANGGRLKAKEHIPGLLEKFAERGMAKEAE